MNIYILDDDIETSVQYHTDKHTVSQIRETVQIMSAVLRKNGINKGYKLTHANHPSILWAGESLDNWLYLKKLLETLHEEYRFRYGDWKTHKSYEFGIKLPNPPIPNRGLTSFAQVVPGELKSDDAVEAYRKYYIRDKQHLATWKLRERPSWFKISQGILIRPTAEKNFDKYFIVYQDEKFRYQKYSDDSLIELDRKEFRRELSTKFEIFLKDYFDSIGIFFSTLRTRAILHSKGHINEPFYLSAKNKVNLKIIKDKNLKNKLKISDEEHIIIKELYGILKPAFSKMLLIDKK